MTYAELAGHVPAWFIYASTKIWPAQGPAGRPRSWNQCQATARMVVSNIYGLDEWPEPVLAFGNVALPSQYQQLDGHFWGEAEVVDRGEPVMLDLTIGQTGYPEAWVMGTAAELAAKGLHYASYMRTPYMNLTYAL